MKFSSSTAPKAGARSATFAAQLAGREFDLVINLQVYFKAGIVTNFTRAPVKLGFDRARARDFNWLFTTHRIPPHAVQHVQDQYFEFLAALGRSARAGRLGSRPVAARSARGSASSCRASTRPMASIVVATSKPQKDWLPERWAEVADALWHDFGLQPVLVGGRSARELHAEQVIVGRARGARRIPRSAAACATSSAFSTARRSCLRPTPGRCT